MILWSFPKYLCIYLDLSWMKINPRNNTNPLIQLMIFASNNNFMHQQQTILEHQPWNTKDIKLTITEWEYNHIDAQVRAQMISIMSFHWCNTFKINSSMNSSIILSSFQGYITTKATNKLNLIVWPDKYHNRCFKVMIICEIYQ
jgi:hypothetical protein